MMSSARVSLLAAAMAVGGFFASPAHALTATAQPALLNDHGVAKPVEEVGYRRKYRRHHGYRYRPYRRYGYRYPVRRFYRGYGYGYGYPYYGYGYGYPYGYGYGYPYAYGAPVVSFGIGVPFFGFGWGGRHHWDD
jgi:hypothetical protein